MKNVNVIPHQYILKRWTKSARDRVPNHDLMETNRREMEVEYHTEMMRWVYDMIMRSQRSPIMRVLLRDSFRQIDQELKRVEADLELDVANNVHASGNSGKRKKKASNESSKSSKHNFTADFSSSFLIFLTSNTCKRFLSRGDLFCSVM